MVPQPSAIHATTNERSHDQLPIDADHSDIVKFHSSQMEYRIVASRIEKLVGQAQAVISRRATHYEKSKLSLAVYRTRAKHVSRPVAS